MTMQSQQGNYVVENISPYTAMPMGEHRTGLDVVMPPQLQAMLGKTISTQELEELGARSEGDNILITYGDLDWMLTLSPDSGA